MVKKIGLIVNPIAGMGGKVALKGTDGPQVLTEAQRLGAVMEAPGKAKRALEKLIPQKEKIVLLTCSGLMGEDICRELGLPFQVVYTCTGDSCADDTEAAARIMIQKEVGLLMFAGGDGTARNIYNAVRQAVPVLGIPAGVKIQSAVFSISAEAAGTIAAQLIQGSDFDLKEREVMDLDESEYRLGHVSAALYGYLQVPSEPNLVQSAKTSSVSFGNEEDNLKAAAEYVVEHMEKDHYYAIGSGSQAKSVSRCLSVDYELLGVDIVLNGKLIAKDVTEEQLWNYANEKPLHPIVSPIGGQGFIFGRGNHQFSSRVLRRTGKENVIVIASVEKIHSIHSKRLLVDCGDQNTNELLGGYYLVVSGYGLFTSMCCGEK